MNAAKAAWKALHRAERQHAREHGWPAAPMNDNDPVTNLIFFHQDEAGLWSVFDILQFTLTAEEAVQVARTWRGFEGRPYIIERGFFMGGASFFPTHHCVNRSVSRGRAPFPR